MAKFCRIQTQNTRSVFLLFRSLFSTYQIDQGTKVQKWSRRKRKMKQKWFDVLLAFIGAFENITYKLSQQAKISSTTQDAESINKIVQNQFSLNQRSFINLLNEKGRLRFFVNFAAKYNRDGLYWLLLSLLSQVRECAIHLDILLLVRPIVVDIDSAHI